MSRRQVSESTCQNLSPTSALILPDSSPPALKAGLCQGPCCVCTGLWAGVARVRSRVEPSGDSTAPAMSTPTVASPCPLRCGHR